MIRSRALLRIFIPIFVIYLIYSYARRGSPKPLAEDVPSTTPLEILIPKTIHQLLISMPEHPVSKFEPNTHTISWQQSGWKVEYWSEEACIQLAQENITHSETIQKLPSAILRSDFCRYLVLFRRGGIYNDLDVHLMKPLPWNIMGPSKTDGMGPPGLIVGLEGDASTKGLPRSPQFLRWTIASTASHLILQGVLDRIAARTPSRHHAQAIEREKDVDVMSWTGPSVWTDAVLDYLDCTEARLKVLRDLKEPLRIKDVLVLPKRTFAIIQGDDHSSPDILVKHYFSGTWKKCEKSWITWLIPWGC
jgi:alpha 1,6-mannosyltransferase